MIFDESDSFIDQLVWLEIMALSSDGEVENLLYFYVDQWWKDDIAGIEIEVDDI